jgi:diaminohydroxyphosphoribosylaminopyrimidine deaminase/5-amino-6-(5-phosphoribosylamino)uracil reductase
MLADLASREVNDVLVEAGPTLSGSLLEAKLVDELVIYQAPHIMGSETRGMVTTPAWRSLQQRLELEILDIRKIGVDIRIVARPVA